MTDMKKEEVKQLTTGDVILLTDGKQGEFLQLKRTRFACLIEDEVWDYPISMFDSLMKKGEPNPALEEVRTIIKQYKNQSIGTVYGPSTIVGLTDDLRRVELLEFGMERYHLSLEDFLNEFKENGIVS